MSFLDKAKDAAAKAKDAAAKAKGLAADNADKIESGLNKAGGFVDGKTGGKYTDKIDSAKNKASDALGKLDGKA